MRRSWKRKMVGLSAFVLIGAAMYLNWSYAQTVAQTERKILGESTLVSSTAESLPPQEVGGEPEEKDYFAAARLTRQQARDSAITLLEQASSTEEVNEAVATEAAESIQVLAAYTLAEAQIENLITAKGYADCVAFMGEDSISVVVTAGKEGLGAADVAKITDVVLTQTDYAAGQIKIMEAN